MRKPTIALLSIILSAASVLAQEEISASKIGENVLVITGGGGNITAIATNEGIVVVDTSTSPALARQARELIQQFSNKPVRYVINTHYHADHTFGNQVFADAALIAHANCSARVRTSYADRAAEYAANVEKAKQLEKEFREAVENDAQKAKEIKTELNKVRKVADEYGGFVLTPAPLGLRNEAILSLGGKTFKLLHFGPGHTDGDLVVFVPEEKLLVTGDLVFHHSIPYIDVGAGADPPGWIAILDKLIAMGDEVQTVVPGHGAVGTVQALRDQRAYLNDLWEAVGSERAKGLTFEKAKRNIKLEQYSQYERYKQAFASNIEACWQIYEKGASQENK